MVHAFASDGAVDEKGYYRIFTSVLVTLKCRDVSASELRDLGPQNEAGCLDKWHEFERLCTEQALQKWCEVHQIELMPPDQPPA